MPDQPTAKLHGKCALVTGSARRIGAAIARRLHAEGAAVAVHYRGSASDADALVQDLNAIRADSASAMQADLSRLDELRRLVDDVVAWQSGVDILVNNASTFYPTPLEDLSEAAWDDLTGSNLKAPVFLAQAALPSLRARRGCIVNLVDIHAQRPLRHHNVYGAAKAGLVMLTRSLAKDLAPDIRVNAVAPGAIMWPEDGMTDPVKESIIGKIPLARQGQPEDIAGAVLFLACDAPYVTGQVIAVDGGRSLGW